MGAITEYGADAFTNHITGKVALPSSFYVALCSAEPDQATDGTLLAALEPSGGSYARQVLNRGAAYWNDAAGGAGTTVSTLSFPTATADWGSLTHYALCTAASGGEVYGWGELALAVFIESGQIYIFDAGSISVIAAPPTETLSV
jgi:hypothetical protein